MTNPIFRCGHPRTASNTIKTASMPKGRCRICRSASVIKQTARTRQIRLDSEGFIPVATDGSGWNDMVTHGTQRLGEAIDRYLGRVA